MIGHRRSWNNKHNPPNLNYVPMLSSCLYMYHDDLMDGLAEGLESDDYVHKPQPDFIEECLLIYGRGITWMRQWFPHSSTSGLVCLHTDWEKSAFLFLLASKKVISNNIIFVLWYNLCLLFNLTFWIVIYLLFNLGRPFSETLSFKCAQETCK